MCSHRKSPTWKGLKGKRAGSEKVASGTRCRFTLWGGLERSA